MAKSVTVSSRMKSAMNTAMAQTKAANPKMPGGISSGKQPAKVAPVAPATSAVAPKVQGTQGAAAKNPGVNVGGGKKLGNHYSNS